MVEVNLTRKGPSGWSFDKIIDGPRLALAALDEAYVYRVAAERRIQDLLDANARYLERARAAEAKLAAPTPVLVEVADALDCFWNAALGHSHHVQDQTSFNTVGSMAEGFAAVARRMRGE